MPAPGEQYRATPASANPFEETVPRISEYTAQEIAILSSRLDKQLGPEYISTRPGQGGGKVHYLAAEKVINLANEVFGFNGWSSQIQNVQVDFVDESQPSGKISLGLSTIVRVTLKDGTFHEDIGYGHIENCKGKAAAFEKAKKEAATDALKRSLRNFGNVLGNCLYDKDYLQRITKVKIAPSKWDADNLHRHHDFRPIKRESIAGPDGDEKPAELAKQQSIMSNSTEFEDEFGGNLFDEVELPDEHPDEVTLHPQVNGPPLEQQHTVTLQAQGLRPSPNQPIATSTVPPGRPNGQVQQQQRPGVPQRFPSHVPQAPSTVQTSNNQMPPPQNGPQGFHRANNNNLPQHQNRSLPPHSAHPEHVAQPPPQNRPAQQNSTPPPIIHPNTEMTPAAQEPLVGFTSGRATIALNPQDLSAAPESLTNLPRFNPKAESPSIRRTTGFDHTKSGKVTRTSLDGSVANPPAPTNVPPTTGAPGSLSRPGPTNFINPVGDAGRRIGMPGGGAPSPLANRTAYRPPGPAAGNKRPYVAQVQDSSFPLADVSNTTAAVAQGSGGEVMAGDESKRQKIAEA